MKTQLVIGLIGLASLVGCTKDESGSPTNTKYLQKYVVTENGGNTTHTISYDNKKRITAIASTEDEYRAIVTYDNKDNVTQLSLDVEGDKQVISITYNNAGQPQSAVMKTRLAEQPNVEKTTSITYQVANDKVTKIKFVDEEQNLFEHTLTYTGNNLTKLLTTGNAGQIIMTYKYGSKKSPFTGARFKYVLLPDMFELLYSENEVIENTIDIPNILSITTKTTYQYDTAGYPTSAEDRNEDGQIERKIVYHY